MVKQVLFLRHLKTANNIEHRINGRSLLMPAADLHPIPCAFSVDAIYCSTALRCRQTLNELASNTASHRIYYTDQLLERDMGLLEGIPRAIAVRQYPELFFDEKFNVFSTPPMGESFEAFVHRADAFWSKCSKNSDGTVLICSHNQFLKMLSFRITGEQITEDAWQNRSFPFGSIVPIL